MNEEYYSKDGSASPEERAKLQRIQQEGSAKKLSVGMVRAYVLSPDGHTYDVVATDTATMTLASLGRAVAQFKPQPGNPVVTPRPQSVCLADRGSGRGPVDLRPGPAADARADDHQGRSQNADLHGGGPNRSAPAPITASPVGASRECRNPR